MVVLSQPLAFTTFKLILEIVDSISGTFALLASMCCFGVDEFVAKDFVVAIAGFLFNDNLLVVVGELIDDIFDGAFAQLELVVRRDAIRRH